MCTKSGFQNLQYESVSLSFVLPLTVGSSSHSSHTNTFYILFCLVLSIVLSVTFAIYWC
jgi:hypothetical protein